MDEFVPSSGTQARLSKARQFSRSPVLFASVQLGKNLNGFILNASEGGLCVQTAKEISGNDLLELRFQSVRPDAWIQARGRVVWTNESKTVAGLEFIETTSEIVNEVRNWLAFGASLQELRGNWWPDQPVPAGAPLKNPIATIDEHQAQQKDAGLERAPLIEAVVSAAASSPLSLRGDFGQTPPATGTSKPGHPAGLWAVAASFVLLVVILFGRQSGMVRRITGISSERLRAGATRPLPSAEAPPAPAPPPRAPSASDDKPTAQLQTQPPTVPSPAPDKNSAILASSSPLGETPSALVLQVAAMNNADNANKLVESLRMDNFPAFVSKRNSDRFYFVLIGPYRDNLTRRQAKTALRNKGYDTIERPWSR